jgi:hypothetical protein
VKNYTSGNKLHQHQHQREKITRKEDTNNANKYRTSQETKFLYWKKQNLNKQLRHIHLICAQYCNGVWEHIQNSINLKLNKFMETQNQKPNKYKKT